MNIKIVKPEEQFNGMYDVFIGVLGYESRCVNVAQKLAKKVSRGFYVPLADEGLESYNIAKKIYINIKYEELAFGVDDEFSIFERILLELPDSSKIAIDVSSMPKSMTASFLHKILAHNNKIETVSLYYCPAKFTQPNNSFSPVTFSGPVLSEYAGWTMYPDKPPIAIIGLGYEFDRAIGVLDYLDVDISNAVLLVPRSIEQKYDHAVSKANRLLLDQVNANQIVYYNLNSPEETLIRLNSIISSLSDDHRVILVPFGPKLINMISLIAAEMQPQDVTVWRVSGGKHELPVDRKPSKTIIRLDIKLMSEK